MTDHSRTEGVRLLRGNALDHAQAARAGQRSLDL